MTCDVLTRLDAWYAEIETDFLARQKGPAMLLPASTAANTHGDYSHAWVRDNVYSILAPWALVRAFARHAPHDPRRLHLEGRVVALMRGLLHAMMAQSDHVERFKHSENPIDALHAKYDAVTGNTLVADDRWGHLQFDATGLYLLFLAQMGRAGLTIVQMRAEACFVQNLVYYIGPAYRSADYGIWERGDKINSGRCEVNASSVGMIKAALEAINGATFMVDDGGVFTIHCVPDEIARCRETLLALLPAESASKETDAALLSIIGFPAFAVEDASRIAETRDRVLMRLRGRYGCKRFLRDGHQTRSEDSTRLHYEIGELARFEHLEPEWPLFFAFLAVNAAMLGDHEELQSWLGALDRLSVEREGRRLLPELYFVPLAREAEEAAQPGSQSRTPNENIPLYWAQSLWAVARLLREGLVWPEDLDPCGRRTRQSVGAVVEIVVCGAAAAQRYRGQPFADLVAPHETPHQSIALCDSAVLTAAWARHGAEVRLGLGGRPPRRLGALSTARLYRHDDQAILFSHNSRDPARSYLRFDAAASADRLRADIEYVGRHWTDIEPPVVVLHLDETCFAASSAAAMDALVHACYKGSVGSAAVRLVSGETLLQRAGARIDDWPIFIEGAPGLHANQLAPYFAAGERQSWADIRREAMTAGLMDERLSDMLKEWVVRLKRVEVTPDRVIDGPVASETLRDALLNATERDVACTILAEEIILHTGAMVKANPARFSGCRSLRLLDWVRHLESIASVGDHCAALLDLAPHQVAAHLAAEWDSAVSVRAAYWAPPWADADTQSWRAWRLRLGIATRLHGDFVDRVWALLARCDGLAIGAGDGPTVRIDARIARSDHTAREPQFARQIDEALSRIAHPMDRTIMMEILHAAMTACEHEPQFEIVGDLNGPAILRRLDREKFEGLSARAATAHLLYELGAIRSSI